ncbi:MAG TPA: hypothetical protein VJR04_14710 [Terriglobales bacterium]|nr:hypothetical protein [Terriglobales bacterium]
MQIHDYNVHVDSNDVFWMIPVNHDAVEVDFDSAQARLRVRDMTVFDDHDLANSLTQGLGIPTPPIPGVFPVKARVSFDIRWNGALQTTPIRNQGQSFKGTFSSTQTTIEWSSEQEGFTFKSEPPDPTRNLISVLGREQNGVFFT